MRPNVGFTRSHLHIFVVTDSTDTQKGCHSNNPQQQSMPLPREVAGCMLWNNKKQSNCTGNHIALPFDLFPNKQMNYVKIQVMTCLDLHLLIYEQQLWMYTSLFGVDTLARFWSEQHPQHKLVHLICCTVGWLWLILPNHFSHVLVLTGKTITLF